MRFWSLNLGQVFYLKRGWKTWRRKFCSEFTLKWASQRYNINVEQYQLVLSAVIILQTVRFSAQTLDFPFRMLVTQLGIAYGSPLAQMRPSLRPSLRPSPQPSLRPPSRPSMHLQDALEPDAMHMQQRISGIGRGRGFSYCDWGMHPVINPLLGAPLA